MWGPVEWTAFGTVALAAVTLGLIFVGLNQIGTLREQNRRWHTLTVCKDFMASPVFIESLRRLRAAKESGELKDKPKEFRSDAVTVLNYLDSVAIGVAQGLYVENLARDHLQAMVEAYVRDYLKDGVPANMGLNPQNFRYLLALEVRWSAISRPMFQDAKTHDAS